MAIPQPIQEVTINWGNEVYSLSDVNGVNVDADVDSAGKDIYQCTGFHHVYGRDVLLYIGYTGMEDKKHSEKAGDIKDEISRHIFFKPDSKVPAFFMPSLVKVRLGKVLHLQDEKDLATIAGLLIFAHAPAWNYGEEIREFQNKYRDFIIENENQCGGLLSVVNGVKVCKK